MSMRLLLFMLVCFPLWAIGQKPESRADEPKELVPELNATTRAVLLANRPSQYTEVEWLRMMEKNVNRSLYPLRVTQAMLDTLDATTLDLRFRYEMVPDR